MPIIRTAALFLSLSLFSQPPKTFGQYGELDNEFDGDGIVVSDAGWESANHAYAVAVQPDGRIVTVGYASAPAGEGGLCVTRYFPDGSLDPSFGGDGRVTTEIAGSNDVFYDVVIQPDGKIVGVGQNSVDGASAAFLVVRYLVNGQLDPTFGSGGVVTTDICPRRDYARAVAIDPDGRIVVGGMFDTIENNDDPVVVRYNPDGSLDNSFSFDGKVTYVLGTSPDFVTGVGIQADGRILVAGNSATQGFYILRYNVDGSLDGSFGTNGLANADLGQYGTGAYAMELQQDGRIVLAGIIVPDNGDIDVGLVRFLSNGTLDPSFSFDGVAQTFLEGSQVFANSMALQPDGKLVVGVWDSPSEDLRLVRYNSDGSLDVFFGQNGVAVADVVEDELDVLEDVAILADGRIIVAGSTGFNTGTDELLACFTSGLDVGVLEFGRGPLLALIYPNPITDRAEFTFELKQEERLTAEIYDAQGKTVRTLFTGRLCPPGPYRETVDLPGIADGNYTLVLSNVSGSTSLKVIKQDIRP